jgi:hypothetical protein
VLAGEIDPRAAQQPVRDGVDGDEQHGGADQGDDGHEAARTQEAGHDALLLNPLSSARR